MRVLELVDIAGDEPVVRNDTATLDQNGKVTFNGGTVRNIISRFLNGHEPSEVFDKMANWSNGYIQLQEREQK